MVKEESRYRILPFEERSHVIANVPHSARRSVWPRRHLLPERPRSCYTEKGRDLLDEVKQRQHVKVQQAEAEVKEAKDKAKVMAHKDVSKAISLLTLVRDGISTDPDLPDATRKVLLAASTSRSAATVPRVADPGFPADSDGADSHNQQKPLDEDNWPRLRLGPRGRRIGSRASGIAPRN